jgi:DNA polymerase III epsilon subunit-like protein
MSSSICFRIERRDKKANHFYMAEGQTGTYLILDLEMTGLNPFQHGVIEVGAMVMDDTFDII